jgi:hypothetical protein
MKCTGCNSEGHPGPELLAGEDPFDKINAYQNEDIEGPLFFKVDGQYYCFPCQCKLTSVCYQCSDEVDALYRDKRCKNATYVCERCLKKPSTNHLWVCYKDGCMTPGEVAQEEWEIIKMESGLYE